MTKRENAKGLPHMNERTARMRRLEALLTEAELIYRELIDTSDTSIERKDWKLDADDVERAAIFAKNQADRISAKTGLDIVDEVSA
jgi:hypothetical protein